MIRKAKALVLEQEFLPYPTQRVENDTNGNWKNCPWILYITAYQQANARNARLCVHLPGWKKQHVQKHLVLCNLKEVYELFKAHHQDIKIGFSKFADLRPRQCVSRIKWVNSLCLRLHHTQKHKARCELGFCNERWVQALLSMSCSYSVQSTSCWVLFGGNAQSVPELVPFMTRWKHI